MFDNTATSLSTRTIGIVFRYHQISTFGRGTIRNFPSNSSEMKKLAARDFEDLLQVCIKYLITVLRPTLHIH
jgi:hypothetical protein